VRHHWGFGMADQLRWVSWALPVGAQPQRICTARPRGRSPRSFRRLATNLGFARTRRGHAALPLPHWVRRSGSARARERAILPSCSAHLLSQLLLSSPLFLKKEPGDPQKRLGGALEETQARAVMSVPCLCLPQRRCTFLLKMRECDSPFRCSAETFSRTCEWRQRRTQ
jgi:hypothetical protein